MPLIEIVSNEFYELFDERRLILTKQIEQKLNNKHHVYFDDLVNALGDPYSIVLKSKRKSPNSINPNENKGITYEIYAETDSNKILFIVGLLFLDGAFYVITARWAEPKESAFYQKESEVLRDE